MVHTTGMGKQHRAERQSERFNMKTSPEFLARLDKWRRKQPDLPNRSEAVRRLVEAAMKKRDP
jgi:metal-responsive CopG/Arc/MetJ family transcriptional regulator